jgi:hypothetical protein
MKVLDPRGRAAAGIDTLVGALGTAHVLPLVLAVPLATVFWLYQPWTMGGGIRAPDSGLVPNIAAIVGYGTAFGFGWLLHRQTTLFEVWRRSWLFYGAAAVILTIYCARTMGAAAADPSSLPATTSMRIVIAMAYPLAIWTSCLALLGAATRFVSGESRIVRYLSDSSYWIYVIHLPIVGAFQVLVSPWSIGWQWKYPLVLSLAIPLLLASYHWLVRGTWLGAWLNGRRYPRSVAT